MRCDSHVHVVGPPGRYPQIAARTYLAGSAELGELCRRAAARDVARFVIVQPSFYGTDNTLLIETLATLGDRGRGVAVVDAATPRAALADCARCGVRGLRVNVYSPLAEHSTPLAAAFAATARIARTFDWHVEVIAPLPMLFACADALAGAAVPVVIDHYGLHGRAVPASAEGRRLIDLLRLPHIWIKLSAPYRIADDPMNTRPDPAWLAAIIGAAANRCVWGSDWPHTPPHRAQPGADVAVPYRDFSYEALVDRFVAALPSAELADRILSVNPARLYGFATP